MFYNIKTKHLKQKALNFFSSKHKSFSLDKVGYPFIQTNPKICFAGKV